MNVVVLVPRREDGGWRDRVWDFCREEWLRRFPDWPIIEGHHHDGPFNRSAAINKAAAEAERQVGHWDVALIIDGDIIADPDAVHAIVERSAATDRMCVSHNRRVMLSQRMTERVMNGYVGSWEAPTQKVWLDSCSCCVAVSRPLWDAVAAASKALGGVGDGAFDEGFVGWGHEDSAFGELAKMASGSEHYENSTIYHLWHPAAKEAAPGNPLRLANEQRLLRLRGRLVQPVPVAAPARSGDTTIPRIFHRTVPADTTAEVEEWWKAFEAMHPGWEMRTWREPIDRADFPLTSGVWDLCTSGAQKAGLIRLEALYTHGGVYIDSDVRPVASFEPLLGVEAFCGWEDERCIPDAILGARPGHPVYEAAIEMAVASVRNREGAWKSGPGVTTALMADRPDVLCLPPDVFYPVHYLEKARFPEVVAAPPRGCLAIHMYHHSWGSDADKANILRNQRKVGRRR